MPEIAFEVSWEVCNKVGGIHTVIASKTPEMIKHLGEQYIVIGPDIWREESENPEFIEDFNLFRGWREQAKLSGINIRTGHWNIEGKPVAIIVDFTPLFPEKDTILSEAWEIWKLDSISGHWDYVEAALFGYAAGQVINSFVEYYRSKSVLAHFHEWMTGMGVLYLKENAPYIGTVFTTHATVLGRSIAGNGLPLYSKLNEYDPELISTDLGVRAKFSLERLAAKEAHGFSTVSEITGKECAHFLGRTPDRITPNGFDALLVPDDDVFIEKRERAKNKLYALAEAITGRKASKDEILIGTSGRYEFYNKGIDIFIKTLGQLNKSNESPSKILAFILVPANHYGPRKSVLSRLEGRSQEPMNSPYLSHNLHDASDDPVLKMLKAEGLENSESDNVQVFFIPSYLNGDDGIINLKYYDLLMGLDLTLFPSYYEPWGYTPLESLAFGVPTMTTNLAGFGLWIQELFPELESNGVWVLDRLKQTNAELIDELSGMIGDYCQIHPSQRAKNEDDARAIAKIAQWNELIKNYEELYSLVMDKSGVIDIPEREPSTLHELDSVALKRKSNDPVWKNVVIESSLPDELAGLEELAKNLWWSWNYEAEELFCAIDPELWEEVEHNPVKLLKQVPYNRLQDLGKHGDFFHQYKGVLESFNSYMNKKEDKDQPKIAYLSMEYGFHSSLKIYSGGLGILAGDYLKEASDCNYQLTGIGLLYRYGYFKQVLTLHGDQVAENMREEFTELPLYPMLDEKGKNLQIQIAFPGRIVSARIWRVPVGRVNLFLLDTDIESNQAHDRLLTSNLYGGDEEHRLKQEMLLGVGGIRMLELLGIKADIFHCNEGHAAFIGFERIKQLMETKNFTFNESREVIRASTLFTTHTPVPAGHDAFHEDLIRTYMGHYPDRLKIAWEEFTDLGRKVPGDHNEKFSMSHLAANLSQEINAVSNLHGEVTRSMFANLWEGYFPEELHIGYVTNGVHYKTWTAKAWQALYLETFGNDFLNSQSDASYWEKIHDVADNRIWQIRESQRNILIEYLKKRLRKNSIRRHEPPGQVLEVIGKLNAKVLTIGFARRFATYKRAHLLFKDIDRLARIINNPARPVQFLFAGKAHPRDKAGQDLIKYIVEMSRRPEFIGRIVFLENYDMNLAKQLVQGVDIWLNTPTRPLEASGTSGMKAIMNAAMNFSVLDGWWCEGYRKGAGWALPEERIYADQGFQDELDATTLYNILEHEIVPAYYDRNEEGVPEAWIKHIKNTIAQIVPKFTTKRMIDDYNDRFYSILSSRISDIKANNYHMARELSNWKKRIVTHWDKIRIITSELPDNESIPLQLGQKYKALVNLEIGELEPEEVGVELIVVGEKANEDLEFIYRKEFTRISRKGKQITYKMRTIPTHPGVFKLGIRIFPKHPKLPHRQDFSYLRWI